MSNPTYAVIAELRTRLVPNRPSDRLIAIPRDMPGIVIFFCMASMTPAPPMSQWKPG